MTDELTPEEQAEQEAFDAAAEEATREQQRVAAFNVEHRYSEHRRQVMEDYRARHADGFTPEGVPDVQLTVDEPVSPAGDSGYDYGDDFGTDAAAYLDAASVADVEGLVDNDDVPLDELREAEVAGKNRKGVLAAIDAAQAQRDADSE